MQLNTESEKDSQEKEALAYRSQGTLVCMRTQTHSHIHIRTCTHTHAYICSYWTQKQIRKVGVFVHLCVCVCVCARSHSYICALIRVFVCMCAGMFAGLQWTGDVSGVQTRQQRGTSVCHFLRHDRQHHPLHPCLGCQPERPVLCHTLPCHSCHLPLLQVMLVVKFEKPSQHSPYS